MCVGLSILSVCLSLCACVWGPEMSSLSLFTLFLRYGLSGNLQLMLSSLTDQQAPQILFVCLSQPQFLRTRVTGACHHTQLLHGCQGTKLWPSCFRSKNSLTEPFPRSRGKHHFFFFKGLGLPCTERGKYSFLSHLMTMAGVF